MVEQISAAGQNGLPFGVSMPQSLTGAILGNDMSIFVDLSETPAVGIGAYAMYSAVVDAKLQKCLFG